MASRRVLIVTYWYPPTPGAGAERAAGFSRHLPEHGWDPIVLTAQTHGASWSARIFGFGESESADEVQTVYRVPDLVGAGDIQGPYTGPPVRKSEHWLRRLVFPDRFAIWAGRAQREARYKLEDALPDIVWTTFPPASAAMAAGILADRFSRPLVIDFRDPWFGAGGYAPQSQRQRERHEELERRLIRQAAAITVISEAMRDDLCRRLDVEPSRAHVITNGFDAARCIQVEPVQTQRPPELVHVGSVSQRNRPDLFLQALAAARRLGPLPWRVRFVGNISAGYIASLGLADSVSITGMVPWNDAWRETCQSTALLLLAGDYVGEWGHNTKVFEYLRSSRPILCLEERPGSNDRRLLESLAGDRSRFGLLTNPASILEGINAVMGIGKESPIGTLDASEGLDRYDRGRLTGQLAEILDDIVAHR